MDDTAQSSQMRQPLGLCILRPKPEPTDAYSSAASPFRETVGAFSHHENNDHVDSKIQCASLQALKTEQKTPVGSSCEPCATEAVKLPSVSVQDERAHTCSYCGKSFSHACRLRMHIRSVHLKERNHKCSQCERTFSQVCGLRFHERSVHLKQRPYSCEHCKQSFTGSSHMQRHIRTIHSNERAHTCCYCSKSFSQPNNLERHVRSVHLMLRPYVCEYCDRSFTEKGSMRRHFRVVHLKLRPYACEYCGQSFTESSSMRKHLRTIHLKSDNTMGKMQTEVVTRKYTAASFSAAERQLPLAETSPKKNSKDTAILTQ